MTATSSVGKRPSSARRSTPQTVSMEKVTRGPRTGNRTTVYAAALAAVGVVALVASILWWHANATDEAFGYAKLRDTVTVQARQDIVVMNSLDAATTDASLQAWLSVSTGVLHDQLAQIPDVQKKALTDSGATTTAKVVDGVLTELDDRAGTARMIASVELTVKAKDGTTSVKRNRFSADLTVDGDRWKLAQLAQVAVNAS